MFLLLKSNHILAYEGVLAYEGGNTIIIYNHNTNPLTVRTSLFHGDDILRSKLTEIRDNTLFC